MTSGRAPLPHQEGPFLSTPLPPPASPLSPSFSWMWCELRLSPGIRCLGEALSSLSQPPPPAALQVNSTISPVDEAKGHTPDLTVSVGDTLEAFGGTGRPESHLENKGPCSQRARA